jgi:hypothetical protein
MTSFDYGALGESEVEMDLAANCRTALQSMATACHSSLPLNFGSNHGGPAHLVDADGVFALPWRANLQVFLI